ncbi:MAG: hypothetical protein AABZ30_04030 [Myxococcota bacterium]
MALFPKAGFSFTETMAGTYTRAGVGGVEGERAVSFTCTARVGDLVSHLFDGRATLDGTVRMEGVATDRALSGHMVIKPLAGFIRYQFDFAGDDGQRYHFAGQKELRVGDLLRTATTLPATVTDEAGAEFARCTVRFDVESDLLKLIASVRPKVSS